LVFSFSSNGNTFANLEEVNFDCHVDEARLFGGQETDDSTTATQVHQWNPPPAQWVPPHTQAVVYTLNIKDVQGKHYFRKNASLNDFCLIDFAEIYKFSYFLPMTVALQRHAGHPGK